MDEVWHTLIYQGNKYKNFEISNKGNLRNVVTGTAYKKYINHQGYYQVCVSLGSKIDKKVFKMHRCVAESFIPNPDNKPTINHIDGNKLNNNVDNLEWATYAENTQHAYKNGLASAIKGENNYFAKLTNEQVKYIRNNYIFRDKEFGCCALAKKFGVNHSKISDVVHYKSYKDVE